MQTKPQFPHFVNPRLPFKARVQFKDGHQGIIVDRAESRWERLVVFNPGERPVMSKISEITRGWMPGEFTCSWLEGKSLTMPTL